MFTPRNIYKKNKTITALNQAPSTKSQPPLRFPFTLSRLSQIPPELEDTANATLSSGHSVPFSWSAGPTHPTSLFYRSSPSRKFILKL